MFEADGRYTGELANWEKLPQLFVNTVRMAAGGIRLSDAKMYSHMSRGAAEISVELDDALANRLRDVPLSVKLLSSTGGEANNMPLRWRDSNTLEADIALTEPSDKHSDRLQNCSTPQTCTRQRQESH